MTLGGPPRAWKAPNFTKNRGYSANRDQKEWDKYQIIAQLRQMPLIFLPWKGAVFVKMFFYMPIPESFSEKKITELRRNDMVHASKPDVDNCIKYALDLVKKVVLVDDNQVCGIFAVKKYAENPRTIISIRKRLPESIHLDQEV